MRKSFFILVSTWASPDFLSSFHDSVSTTIYTTGGPQCLIAIIKSSNKIYLRTNNEFCFWTFSKCHASSFLEPESSRQLNNVILMRNTICINQLIYYFQIYRPRTTSNTHFTQFPMAVSTSKSGALTMLMFHWQLDQKNLIQWLRLVICIHMSNKIIIYI